jgi:hypothetical protein
MYRRMPSPVSCQKERAVRSSASPHASARVGGASSAVAGMSAVLGVAPSPAQLASIAKRGNAIAAGMSSDIVFMRLVCVRI